jgi:transcriptional regulator with XRE-family HTH domain
VKSLASAFVRAHGEIGFSDLMRLLREDRNLSARKLSALAGVSQSYVSKMERGEFVPTVDTFARLMEALGCNDAEISFLIRVFVKRGEMI